MLSHIGLLHIEPAVEVVVVEVRLAPLAELGHGALKDCLGTWHEDLAV